MLEGQPVAQVAEKVVVPMPARPPIEADHDRLAKTKRAADTDTAPHWEAPCLACHVE